MSDCRKCADFEWCMEYEECGMFKPKTITNADHIRSMTDEGLAAWFTDKEIKAYERCGYKGSKERFEKQWLEWLKQEADNGKD